MPPKSRCPTCGAELSGPEQGCPFCAEARRLVEQLATEDQVHLCSRCGILLEEDEDLCEQCRLVTAKRRPSWRREDRIARWIRDRIEKPLPEMVPCPHCEQPLAPLAIFCPQCGRRIRGKEEVSEEMAPPVVQAETESAAEEEAPTGLPGLELPSMGQVWVSFRDAVRQMGGDVREFVGPSFWPQVWRFFRSLFKSARASGSSNILLWAIVVISVVGLLAMVVFWAQLLSSGDIIFR